MGLQGPPAVDFYSQLSGLGDTLQANAALRQKQAMDEARKGAFSEFTALDPRSPDYGKQSLSIAQKLGSVGDQEGAIKFIGLAQANADRVRQTERDAAADRHQSVMERLAVRSANRADDTTPSGFAKGPDGTYAPLPGGPQDPKYQAALAKAKAEAEALAPGSGGASLNPIYGVGADGKPAIIQTTKTGKAIQTELPSGFQISKEPIKVDQGTHYQFFDPQTRLPIGAPISKNLPAVEVAKAEGEATGAAKVALPQMLATSAQTLKTIEELKNHPGLDHSVGAWSVVPNIPGSEGANFAAKAAQLKGQTFLQAYQSLRGSGAITDIEGKKGEDAIANLDKAQSKKEYIKSLNDLKTVVETGMLRAAAKARGAGTDAEEPSTTGQPNRTASGVPWSIQ